jgi:hypothetical protein
VYAWLSPSCERAKTWAFGWMVSSMPPATARNGASLTRMRMWIPRITRLVRRSRGDSQPGSAIVVSGASRRHISHVV